MQRPIKFRAWAYQRGELFEVNAMKATPFGSVVSKDNGKHWFLQYELMQYTGLKDKQGKEIYEGDILELNKGEHEEVIWKSDEACFAIRDTDSFITCGLLEKDSVKHLKVIGNIYEDSHLLDK